MSLLNRSVSLARDAAEKLGRTTMGTANRAIGVARSLSGGAKPMDDVTLARKVETQIFREADAPKGTVDVNVAEGVVELRGEVKTARQKADLEARTRKIPEVRDVHNLLHLRKTPAPTRADSPGRARRKTTETKKKTARTGRARTTAERKPAAAEPGPTELASQGKGRQPAPMGSHEPETTAPGAGTTAPEAETTSFAEELERDPASTPPPELDRLRGA
jgi:hypothetical protein